MPENKTFLKQRISFYILCMTLLNFIDNILCLHERSNRNLWIKIINFMSSKLEHNTSTNRKKLQDYF